MVRKFLALMAVCGCMMGAAAYGQDRGILVDVGTAITLGNFSYGDATVDISKEFFNPRVSVEYIVPETMWAFGIAYASTENTFDLELDDGETTTDGSLDVERTDIIPYIRLGSRESMSLRFAYRKFNYEFSNGSMDETENGAPTKRIRNGTAEGDLATGIDAELNVMFGGDFQVGFMFGVSYFMGATYSWEYSDELAGGAITTGSAELDAISFRVAPEASYRFNDTLRVFANYTVAATSWLGSKDEEVEDYAGTDIMSGLVVGVRYNI